MGNTVQAADRQLVVDQACTIEDIDEDELSEFESGLNEIRVLQPSLKTLEYYQIMRMKASVTRANDLMSKLSSYITEYQSRQ